MTDTDVQDRRGAKRREKPRAGFRPDLQGMRAVAVLAVLFDHLFGWPSGGFVGVDIFFVLSGFFITGLLLRERGETGRLSFRRFYVRRVRRIIPAAVLVLAVTVLFSYIIFPAIRAKETLVDGLWAAIFLANWRFEQSGTDYFQEGQPPSPLQHFWSLSIEEQFYFVWPVLLLGLFWLTRKAHRRGRSSVRHSALAATMLTVVALSFGWAMVQSASEPTTAYFSTFTRVWELGAGALVAIAGPALARIPHTIVRPILAYVGLAGVLSSLFVISERTQFPGPGAALPVLSTMLVIAAFHGSEVRGMQPLTNPFALYFGNVSYSLYLWHWPVIVLLAALMPANVTYYILAAVLALSLSHISFTFYENPIHKSKWLEVDTKVRKRGGATFAISPQSWSMAGFLLVSLLCASLLAMQISDRNSRLNEASETLAVAQVVDSAGPAIDPCFGAAALAIPDNGCATDIEVASLAPSVDRFAKDTQGAYSCWRGEGQSMPRCSFGSTKDDALRVALIGDSHAAMLLPALGEFMVSENWHVTAYVGWACQWRDDVSDDCEEAMKTTQNALLTEEPYDVILTTSSRKYGGDGPVAIEAYKDAWAPVAARGTKIIAVADNPAVSDEMLSCVTRFGASSGDLKRCGQSRQEAFFDEDPLIAAASATPGAEVLDMNDLYCAGNWCPSIVGGVIAYRDTGGHLTATYAKTLAPFMKDRLVALIA
ncbi:acyltransferase (plasmid) [Rhodococcus sp. USK10]|uniref:acyltransferase family protein n=1 Tax=Rhodococcus sp. USK10 TaxID=2789739 RepID=UPI001C5DC414|nr:acyltransferase family protein [Rhodococcus sp. USK10]QYB00073.1 acyltransferase [Rhodococcus sp. USK10]